MADNAIGTFFSFLGWSFIPGYATSTLQNIFYRITVPVGQTPPRPGTQQYIAHYRRIRFMVLSLYLVYTLAQSLYDIRLAGDFFTILAVTPSSPDREIKSKFRRLAAKYHPDKVVSSSPGEIVSSSDAYFLLLKLAQDTLLNPKLRYAYLRFGPSITAVQHRDHRIPSIRSYVYAGLRYTLLPSYIANIATLVGMNYFLLPKWGVYWRYLLLTVTATVELYFLTHAEPSLLSILPHWAAGPLRTAYGLVLMHSKLATIIPPHLLPFQTMAVLRKLSISLNIFISQLAPPQQAASLDSNKPNTQLLKNINHSLAHLHAVAKRTDTEGTGLLQLQLSPFRGQEREVELLRQEMREGMVMGVLRSHPAVKQAMDVVIKQRKLNRRRQEQLEEQGETSTDGLSEDEAEEAQELEEIVA